MKPALEDRPALEACCTGQLPAVYVCHYKFEARISRKIPCVPSKLYLDKYYTIGLNITSPDPDGLNNFVTGADISSVEPVNCASVSAGWVRQHPSSHTQAHS